MNINKALFQFIKIGFTIMIVLLVLYGVMRVGTTAYDFGYRLFTEKAVDEAPGKDVLVQIKEDTSTSDIGQLLESKGLVRDHNLFYLQLRLSAYYKKIEPGVYTLNTSMTPKEMMIAMSPEEGTEEAVNTEAAMEGTTQTTEVE